MLVQYFKDIYKTYKVGDATEASYYGDLKKLLENFLKSKGTSPNITIHPRRTRAGIPDFTVRKDRELVGYIEAKDISEDLQRVADTPQLKRYKERLPNFILTNYFDFWLWRRDALDEKKGQWVKKLRIGQPVTLKLNTPPPPQSEKEFFELLDAFFSYYLPERKTAKSLAIELASRAQLLRPYIIEELQNESGTEVGRIYSAFRDFLIHDLSQEDFADIYAQTITYGLFTARLRYEGRDFNRLLAQELVPKNIQILHDTFHLVSHDRLTESLAWIIDDMATVLAHADMGKIREELHRRKGGDDPLMHFYETFLAEYDPEKRKARGVYYTPLPVVSYITRSINILLKEKFGKELGFASEGVTLLDPASGTLTFPSNAVMLAKEEIDASPIAGSWLQIVKKHILQNYYAFELLMAPYIIGHLKVSLLLEDLGYKIQNSDRFKLYLTNTLDFSEVERSPLPFVAGLSEEAIKASQVKKETPILVIMGNPPYSSGHSEQSEFVKITMKDYLTGLGVEKEKKKGVMQDDYIRFIRFAHWKVEQAGKGIIGFITNNSYLDGIIHRAMRKKLLDDFNEIYILNLHGSTRLREKTPEGGKDENVFDIQQGVGIALLVKSEGLEKKFLYFDLYGLCDEKYKFLESHDIKNIEWQELNLGEPYYFFVPKDTGGEATYNHFIYLGDIFRQYNSGVQTKRDNLVIDVDKRTLESKIRTFLFSDFGGTEIKRTFHLSEKGDVDLEKARERIKKSKSDIYSDIFSYVYRPLDNRWIYFRDELISRVRKPLSNVLIGGKNLALVCSRKLPINIDFKHGFVVDRLVDLHSVADQSYFFPLFIYTKNREADIFGASGVQQANFNSTFWQKTKGTFIETVDPWSIFNYIYAVLYSNIYRKKYNEFLKIDFPRIPFTKDAELFYKIAALGKELVDLHLLKSERLETVSVAFPVIGDNIVRKREYREKEGRLYINDTQYFGTVTLEVWNYYIGGYQVLDKWLKDRLDRVLSVDDVNHFLKVIAALNWTIILQKEIDKLYPEVEKSLLPVTQ